LQRYLGMRLFQIVIALLIISIIVFVLVRLSGDPARLLAPPDASKEEYEAIRHNLGLDKAIFLQFVNFFSLLVRGDFGTSFRWHAPALELVLGRFPATLTLACAGFLISVVIGFPLGIVAAVRKGSIWDTLARILATLGQSIPVFWVGIMLILTFSVDLRILPVSGRGGLKHLILPAVTLSSFSVSALVRLTRSSMLDVLGSEYVKMARIKGVPEILVIMKHALRNALIPLVTIAGMQLAALLTGAIVTEVVFAWPGIGRLSVEAVIARDFPVVQAAVFIFAVTYLTMNLIVDMLYCYIDPRIRY